MASTASAQSASQAALRFFGTGVDAPGQQDRVRIAIDDNVAGPDASTTLDLGAGSFSIDFWIRGTIADNPSPNVNPPPGGREFFDFRWIDGHIVIDRDIWGSSSQDWGISIARGRVRFGTGFADSSGVDVEHTIESGASVLSGTWRHVAVVRNAVTGVKSIYVDGVLDYASPPNRSRDDISYPNQGVASVNTPWCPFIVIAAEKHDAGAAYPSFRGYLDEVRFWNVALSAADIAARYNKVYTAANAPVGLVGAYRFEEGTGTLAGATLPGAPAGQLIAGVSGNGEWVRADVSASNVAPVQFAAASCAADFNQAGGVSVRDIFDFLADWNNQATGGPVILASADFNGVDGITVQDIFDFLSAWNIGCP